MSKMKMLIKYPEWQPDYLAAVTEMNAVGMLVKVLQAETLIFNRCQDLTSRDATDEEELQALAKAIKRLKKLKVDRLGHPDWK